MEGIELATWVLVVVTSGLFLATTVYVITAVFVYKASKKQTKVMTMQVEVLEKQVTAQIEQVEALRGINHNLGALHDILGSIEGPLHAMASRMRGQPTSS